MALTIGEITNDVELTAPQPPAAAAASAPVVAPDWVRRAAHRALVEAVERDERRTAVEDRDV